MSVTQPASCKDGSTARHQGIPLWHAELNVAHAAEPQINPSHDVQPQVGP